MVWAIDRSKLLKELLESATLPQLQPPPAPQVAPSETDSSSVMIPRTPQQQQLDMWPHSMPPIFPRPRGLAMQGMQRVPGVPPGLMPLQRPFMGQLELSQWVGKRNRLTCERVEQLVFIRFNNIHAKRKIKAKENKRVDPLLSTDATFAQGWMVQGADDESFDVEPVTGLTWKIIAETCGDDEVTQLRRSARLAQSREIEEDVYSESEEEAIDDEDIEFESNQDEVVTTGYDQEGEEDIDV
ncbi:hypothetical protein E2562_036636 [Oryza meyeriana var. granulata]|uniref:Uncharacterized protein n=1 Tax=Oryza meyeriana var. granulata TaxID=110450 RepID=A0A6G1DAS8_9ORYZ|nr:hypothetical protein E2562_036636 [Oryza meyeriana var. granulata]